MHIKLRMFGALQDCIGSDHVGLELPEGARVDDLYDALQEEWGAVLPPEFWNPARRRFREQVVVMSNQQDLHDDQALLADGQEIWLIEAIAGG